jgi:N-acetylneuraminic acid mutarotase
MKKVWALNLKDEAAGWKDLPEFPGAARQGSIGVVVGDAIYYWGGFSYSEPYCYTDGWRLEHKNEQWTWAPLPPLPWPISGGMSCHLGAKIYALGGADYDSERFYTAADRHGGHKRLGAQFLAFDTTSIERGWQPLPECPGTPRWVGALAAVEGKIYVIGGATGDPYATVVDNWVYDPAAASWARIRDLPIASGNFPSGQIVFRNRYILLGGGYQYSQIANPDGTTRPPYGTPHRFHDKGDYYSDMFVYDTKSGLFGRADSMPLNNNLSMMLVYRDSVLMLGGETGGAVVEGEFYGHHPDLFLKGAIAVADPRQ